MREKTSPGQSGWWARVCAGILVIGVCLPARPGRAADLDDAFLQPKGFESFSLSEALLVASGVKSREELTRESAKLDAVVHRLVELVQKQKLDSAEQPEALRNALHSAVLKQYTSGVSDLRVTLNTGRYNCLTASALYVLAAKELGLMVNAYAMKGHVMAVAYLPDGPRFLETTDPAGTSSRTWDTPSWAYLERIGRKDDDFDRIAREMLKEIAVLQQAGRDEEAQVLMDKLARRSEKVFEEADKREDELRQSAFEVDPQTLASFFYWNRAAKAAALGNEARAIRAFTLATALGSKTWSTQALGVRMFQLQGLLLEHAQRRGWESAVRALNILLKLNQNAREALVLRDLRAQAWRNWALHAPPDVRCRVVEEATKADAAHPLVQRLTQDAAGWACRKPVKHD